MADPSADTLKVFISYSRKDSAEFADELVLGLEDRGFAHSSTGMISSPANLGRRDSVASLSNLTP